MFSPHALATHLTDRLQLLTRGPRTAAPRQQTLRATFDWSYETLTPAEQLAFCRLAVFEGCFDQAAAGAALVDPDTQTPDVLDILTRLADKSLLDAHASGAGVHFRLLETTRAYALEKLRARGETPANRC